MGQFINRSLKRARALACCAGLVGATSAFAAPPAGRHEIAHYKLGGNGGWDYLTVDAAARRLYIARSNRVMVIDADSGALIGEVPGLEGAHGVVPAPELQRGFATSGRTGEVVAFDLTSLKVTGRVKVGENPDALLLDPFTRKLFAFNGKDKSAAIVDPATLTVGQTLALGGKPEFAVSDGAGRIYVNIEDTSELVVLRVAKDKPAEIAARYPLAPCEEPTGLALVPEAKKLLVGCSNRTAVAIDAQTGKVLQDFKTGDGVDAAAYDAARGFGYVSAREGLLTVLKAEHGVFTRVEDVVTVKGSRTLAVDPKTGHVFLPAAQFETLPTPPTGQAPRPSVTPGSFFVLVVGK